MARLDNGKWHALTIPSRPEDTLAVEEAIIEALSRASFGDTQTFAVRLALDEALANAIKHGNDSDPSRKVDIRYRFDGDSITICVKDEGPGFDIDTLPDPTAEDRLEVPSGRGILLMRAYMDKVAFNDVGNEVTMVKRRKGDSK